MHRVTVHLDPSCPWSWLTSRWLLRVGEAEGFEVGLQPLSLSHLERDEQDSWSDDQRDKRRSGQSALRVITHLVDQDDEATAWRFYDTWGDLAHRQRRRREPALVFEALVAAGLDGDATAAAGDADADRVIAERTDAALEAVGPGVGSPVLSWRDGDTDVWIFGPILDELPDAGDAIELWHAVRALARQDRFKELKRGRRGGPQVSAR